MRARVPGPSGPVEVEATPEELASFLALLAAAPAPPEVKPAAAPAAPVVPKLAAVAASGAAAPHVTTRAMAAATKHVAFEVEAPAGADHPGIPTPSEIRDFLASRADFEHSIRDIFHHFNAGPVSPTEPDGTLNPVHQRWMDHINKARALVIQQKKGFFKTEWRGGEKVYVFWYAPFQDFGTPVAP